MLWLAILLSLFATDCELADGAFDEDAGACARALEGAFGIEARTGRLLLAPLNEFD